MTVDVTPSSELDDPMNNQCSGLGISSLEAYLRGIRVISKLEAG